MTNACKHLPTRAVTSCIAVVMSVAGCSGSSDSNAPSTASQNEELESQNKALVRRFYTEVIGQNKTDLIAELFAADYIQHDSTVPSGPAGQITLVENLKTKIPGLVATIKHIGADGDYVAVHWHASATPDNEATGQAAIDLYRVSDGKIAEHWTLSRTCLQRPRAAIRCSAIYTTTSNRNKT